MTPAQRPTLLALAVVVALLVRQAWRDVWGKP